MSNARKVKIPFAVSRKHENIAEIEESISNINDDIKFKMNRFPSQTRI